MSTTSSENERSEAQRLAALQRYTAFDYGATFDRITRLAAETFDVPVAQVNLIGETHHHPASCYGFEAEPIPREHSFCHRTIQTSEPLVIENPQQDARFADNPFVTAEPHLRFYAGVPLVTPDGHRIGSLCLLDTAPRTMSTAELERLEDLAALAMEGLELRRQRAASTEAYTQEKQAKVFAQSVIEGLPGVFYLFDQDGHLKQWNSQFAEVTEYAPEEIQQMQPLDFIQAEDRPQVEAAIAETFADGEANAEARIASKTGAPVPYLLRGKRLRIGGEPHLAAMGVDISERKKTKAALRESEKRFRALVEHGSDVIAILEEDGAIRYQSPSVERVMGRPAGSRYGESVFNKLHPDDREHVSEAFARCLNRPGELVSTQLRMERDDGSWVHLESTARNLLDDPDMQGIVVNSRDISERVKAREELSQRLKMEKTLARISEELLTEPADLDAVVAMLGKAVGVKHAYLCRLDDERRTLTAQHKWSAPGTAPQVAVGQPVDLDDFSWWRETIRECEALPLLVSELPPEAQSEQRFYRKHGIASLLDVPIRFSDGTFFGYIGFSASTDRWWADEDIRLLRVAGTLLAGHFERQRSAEALRATEEQFRTIAETVTQVFWILTPQKDEVLYVSPAFENIWGRPLEEVGDSLHMWKEALHPEDRERVLAAREDASTPGNYDLEFRIVRPDGAVRWIHDRAFPVYDERGALDRIVGVAEDITERKERAEALRQSERKFRSVVENARDIIFQTDAEGRWTLLSPSWEETTGYTVEESLGTPYTQYQVRDETVDAYRERLVREGDAVEDLTRYRTKAGEVRWFHVSSRLIRGEDGTILGGTGTLTDVTDEMRFEAEREARQRAEELLETKTSFLNAMSHELRTPLASILGFADVLVEEGEGQQREFAQHIAQSGKRLRNTLDSVLRLAQLDGQEVELDRQPLDLSEAVRAMTTLLGVTAREAALSLDVETPGEAVYALLDEGALQRILDNLVGNAIKFTEVGGIIVRVEGDAHRARIEVEDTGIGIGESFQSKLFEDFAQESMGLSRTHEGSGLGLAITKRLVELMDGSVTVESEKGAGTVFTVSFPRLRQAPDATHEDADEAPGAPPSAPCAANLPVLLVEDNPTMRHLGEHILEPCYDLTAASGFDEALAAAEEQAAQHSAFKLLLLDIDLGEDSSHSGTQLLRQLRETSAYAETPAMALTAYAMPGDRERFLQAGFDDYLPKPFTKTELLEYAARATSPQHTLPVADPPSE